MATFSPPPPPPHPTPPQVHEKHILIPLLPAALLAPRVPTLFVLFSAMATLSLFPLLARDGQRLPYYVLQAVQCAHMASSLLSADSERDAATLAPLVPKWLPPRTLLRTASCSALVGILALHTWEATLLPPKRYPDLYPVAFSTFSFVFFAAAYVGLLAWQWRVAATEPAHTPLDGVSVAQGFWLDAPDVADAPDAIDAWWSSPTTCSGPRRSVHERVQWPPVRPEGAAEVSAPALPARLSPARLSPARPSPAGLSPAGLSPAELLPARLSPVAQGASPTVRASPLRSPPAGLSPARLSPAGLSPARLSPVAQGASPTVRASPLRSTSASPWKLSPSKEPARALGTLATPTAAAACSLGTPERSSLITIVGPTKPTEAAAAQAATAQAAAAQAAAAQAAAAQAEVALAAAEAAGAQAAAAQAAAAEAAAAEVEAALAAAEAAGAEAAVAEAAVAAASAAEEAAVEAAAAKASASREISPPLGARARQIQRPHSPPLISPPLGARARPIQRPHAFVVNMSAEPEPPSLSNLVTKPDDISLDFDASSEGSKSLGVLSPTFEPRGETLELEGGQTLEKPVSSPRSLASPPRPVSAKFQKPPSSKKGASPPPKSAIPPQPKPMLEPEPLLEPAPAPKSAPAPKLAPDEMPSPGMPSPEMDLVSSSPPRAPQPQSNRPMTPMDEYNDLVRRSRMSSSTV